MSYFGLNNSLIDIILWLSGWCLCYGVENMEMFETFTRYFQIIGGLSNVIVIMLETNKRKVRLTVCITPTILCNNISD